MKGLGDLEAVWPKLNGLLDEALALPPPDREGWLRELPAEHAALRETLSRLLDLRAGAETGDFLRTLPKLGATPLSIDPSADIGAPRAGDEVGPYRLLRELGEGGMGSVWLAERSDGQLKRQVALKLPRLSWARGLAERMARERDILASLEHPFIARLYDAGVDQFGRPWMALEYVEGQPIDLHCRERRLSVRERVTLLLQVCDAVAYAHSRLVIHRDLKPSNILVSRHGEVKLLDFGVAKLLGDERAQGTPLTELVGRALTPRYASPEQLRGESLTTASDVYSLGVVAYELLTDEPPYRTLRGSAAELENVILAAEVPPASAAARDPTAARALRGDLDAVIAQSLRKLPAERYATVLALADDLRRWLADDAVLARPEQRRKRMLRTLRRHRLPFAAATAVLVSLAGGSGVALWQAEIARSEARTSQAVQRFLEGILGASDPNQRDPAQARERTARELMDIGAQRIETELSDDPAAQARVMGTLARIYDTMGEFDRASRLSELRLALLARTGGIDTSAHLLASAELANAQRMAGRHEAAQRTLEDVERRLAAMGRTDPRLRAAVLTKVANGLDTRDPARAMQAAREAADLLESAGTGAEREEAWRRAGIAAFHAQAFEEAREALQRARDLALADGGMPANLADTLSFLGSTELALDHVAQAEAALRESVRLADTAAGTDRRPALMARAALANLLFRRGQLADALALYERVRTAYLQLPVGGRGADSLASVVSFETSARLQYGHVDEALQLIEQTLAGPDSSTVPAQYRIGLLNQRALIWIDVGQATRAAQALAEAEQVIAMEQLQANPVAAAVQLARSRWLLLQGRPGEARDLLEQAVRQLDRVDLEDASHPADLTLAARIDIARARWDAAAQWAERALARASGKGVEASFDSAVAWHALGVAQLGAGRVDAALRSLERAVAQFEGIVDRSRSPHLARALADHGRALRQAGRAREAQALEQRSRRILALS